MSVSYGEFIQWLIDTGDTRIFRNSDYEHAITVLVTYFKNAKRNIRIYAGCLAPPIGTNEEYVKALCSFVKKDGTSLRILLTDYNAEKTKDTLLFKELSSLKNAGYCVEVKSTAKRLSESGKPVHFAVVDNNIRIEIDTTDRKALCRVNYPKGAERLRIIFDEIFNSDESSDINLGNSV